MSNFKEILENVRDTLETATVKNISIIGVMISVFFVGKCTELGNVEKITIEFAEYKKEAKKTTQLANTLKYQVDELVLAVEDKENTISSLQNAVTVKTQQKNVLEKSIRALEQTVVLTKLTADTAQIVVTQDKLIEELKTQVSTSQEIIDTQETQLEVRKEQILALQQASALAMKRGDELQLTIDKLQTLNVDDGRWFFGKLKKPSRTTSAGIALGVGIVTGALLTR